MYESEPRVKVTVSFWSLALRELPRPVPGGARAETKRTAFFEKAILTLPAFSMTYSCVARCFSPLAGLLARVRRRRRRAHLGHRRRRQLTHGARIGGA